MRDLRDPQKLGEAYLHARGKGLDIEIAVGLPARPYADGGHISSNPADHHSNEEITEAFDYPVDS